MTGTNDQHATAQLAVTSPNGYCSDGPGPCLEFSGTGVSGGMRELGHGRLVSITHNGRPWFDPATPPRSTPADVPDMFISEGETAALRYMAGEEAPEPVIGGTDPESVRLTIALVPRLQIGPPKLRGVVDMTEKRPGLLDILFAPITWLLSLIPTDDDWQRRGPRTGLWSATPRTPEEASEPV